MTEEEVKEKKKEEKEEEKKFLQADRRADGPIKDGTRGPRWPKKVVNRGRTRSCNPQIPSLVPSPISHTWTQRWIRMWKLWKVARYVERHKKTKTTKNGPMSRRPIHNQINEKSIYVINIMASLIWLSPQILDWIWPGGTGRGQETACVMDMAIARADSTRVQPKNIVTPATIWCCYVVGGFFIASHASAWDTQLIAKTKNIQKKTLLD